MARDSASSRAAAAAWRTPGDAWTDDQTFAPGACDASRFAFAVVRSEAARRVAFDHGWFRRWSSPTAPEAVDVLCEVGQVVLRVAAGEALISEEAMKAPYLRACVVSASWRGGSWRRHAWRARSRTASVMYNLFVYNWLTLAGRLASRSSRRAMVFVDRLAAAFVACR